jgi:hypothetical protein
MLPADSQQIAEQLGVSRSLARKWLRHLRAGGVISFRSKVGQQGCRRAVLRASTAFERAGCSGAPAIVSRFISAWDALASRQTTATLSCRIGVGRRTGMEIVAAMRAAGLVRIAGWQMRGPNPTAVYDRLDGADAPRPERKSRHSVNADHWAKRRQAAPESAGTVLVGRSVTTAGVPVGAPGCIGGSA